MFICTPRVVKPRALLAASIQSPDSDGGAKFDPKSNAEQNLDPKSYADLDLRCRLTLLSEAATKSQPSPITTLGSRWWHAQNSRLLFTPLFAGKTQISVGVFSSLRDAEMMRRRGDWFMPLRLRISNHWSEREVGAEWSNKFDQQMRLCSADHGRQIAPRSLQLMRRKGKSQTPNGVDGRHLLSWICSDGDKRRGFYSNSVPTLDSWWN